VVDHVAGALRYLLERCAESGRCRLDLFDRSTKPDQALVKGLSKATQHLTLVALRIDGDEKRLHMRGRGPDLIERVGKHAEPRRAQIGTVGIAEIDQHPLAWKVGAAHDAAVGIDEVERMVRREPQLFRRSGANAHLEQDDGQYKRGNGVSYFHGRIRASCTISAAQWQAMST
jgi:hypothetical protein